jgi:hypothetical protein
LFVGSFFVGIFLIPNHFGRSRVPFLTMHGLANTSRPSPGACPRQLLSNTMKQSDSGRQVRLAEYDEDNSWTVGEDTDDLWNEVALLASATTFYGKT